MWNAISSILNGSNAIVVLVFLLIVSVIFIIMVKKGYIKIAKKGVSIGLSEDTAKMINLFDYVKSNCEAFTSKLLKEHTELNADKAKYICSRVEDIFQKALVVNHMTTDDVYIKTKQTLVYNSIVKRTDNDYFSTDEFKKKINDFTYFLIKDLIKLKR